MLLLANKPSRQLSAEAGQLQYTEMPSLVPETRMVTNEQLDAIAAQAGVTLGWHPLPGPKEMLCVGIQPFSVL